MSATIRCPHCNDRSNRAIKKHCVSPTCSWVRCEACGATIDTKTSAFFPKPPPEQKVK